MNRYFKNFNVFKCSSSDTYILKLECCVNGLITFFTLEITEIDYKKISKILDNYNRELKEIMNNGK